MTTERTQRTLDAVRRQALAELAASDEWVPEPGEVPQSVDLRHVLSGRTQTPEVPVQHNLEGETAS